MFALFWPCVYGLLSVHEEELRFESACKAYKFIRDAGIKHALNEKASASGALRSDPQDPISGHVFGSHCVPCLLDFLFHKRNYLTLPQFISIYIMSLISSFHFQLKFVLSFPL